MCVRVPGDPVSCHHHFIDRDTYRCVECGERAYASLAQYPPDEAMQEGPCSECSRPARYTVLLLGPAATYLCGPCVTLVSQRQGVMA